MFEFLNYGALSILGSLGVATIVIGLNSKKSPVGLYTIVLISIGLVFLSAYNEHSTVLENINDFKNKKATLNG